MSAQEETQEDTIAGSSNITSSVEQQRLETREKNRQRNLIYRHRRRQREVDLKASYQLLQANYRTLEANYLSASRQNILLAIEVEGFKSICQRLITTLIQHQTNPERRSPENEYITPNNREEIREEEIVNSNNEASSFTLEDSHDIRNRIDNLTIQHGETTMRATNWANHLDSIPPNEL